MLRPVESSVEALAVVDSSTSVWGLNSTFNGRPHVSQRDGFTNLHVLRVWPIFFTGGLSRGGAPQRRSESSCLTASVRP